MPSEPLFCRTPAYDLVRKKRIDIVDGIYLRRCRILPGKTEQPHPPFHLAQDGPRLLTHAVRTGVAGPNYKAPITPLAFWRFPATGHHEGWRGGWCRGGIAEGMERGL